MRPLVERPVLSHRCAAALLAVALSAFVASSLPAQGAGAARRAAGARVASGSESGRAAAGGGAFAVRGTVGGDDIVRAARRFIGVRYRLGADSPSALDCSSFVRRVFAEYGVAMPRTAREQAAVGKAPTPGDLRAGDLLFFYGGHGAQHIAIYVGGDTIIHASSRGRRVQLDRLGGRGQRRSWFNERLIAVRRVAPLEGVFRLSGASTAPPPPQRTASVDSTEAVRAATVALVRLSPGS